jgi:hypothetical protein
MTEMDCARADDAAAEFALGVLPGRDRAQLIAHVEECAGCRARLADLADLADNLIALVPAAEPPPCFETRVLAAVGALPAAAPRRRRWPRTVSRALAAVVLAAVVAMGGWSARGIIAPTPTEPATTQRPAADDPDSTTGDAAPTVTAGPRTVQFASLTNHGTRIGQVYAYPGPPSWIYMAVDTHSGDTTVSCQLLYRDGPPIPLGTFQLSEGYAAWGSPVPPERSHPDGAQLVDDHGVVLATATFP